MMVYIEDEGSQFPLENYQDLTNLVIINALTMVGFPSNVEINLLLTHNEEIRSLNHEFRGVDQTTDVLSFPYIDFHLPGIYPETAEIFINADPSSQLISLGDIVLSKDKVYEQARAYGHSPVREYSFLLVHSVLHLLGYDHIEDKEREAMEHMQKKIMKKLQIFR